MKVAFTVGNLIKDFDGVSRVAYKYIESLKNRGADFVAFSQIIPPPKDQIIPMFKAPSFAFPLYKKYRVPVFSKTLLNKELGKFGPDIIHVHSPDSLGWEAANYGRSHEIPVLATHHTRFEAYLSYYHLPFLTNLAWLWMKELYAKCRVVFCPSRQIVHELNAEGIFNAVLLPHGVDTDFFNPSNRSLELRRKLGIENKIALLFVARLVWEKDLKVLAEAYKTLENRDDIVFLLVGDGPARKELERMMPGALFLGQKSAQEVALIYACSDIFVFPSTTETFGLVALEAMASGLPVVASHSSGLEDIVQDGKTGLLARPKDGQDFASKIIQLLDDHVLRAEMSSAAYSHAKTQSWEKIIDKLLFYYRKTQNTKY